MAEILFDLMTIRIHDAPANLLRLLTEAGYIHDVALTKRVANETVRFFCDANDRIYGIFVTTNLADDMKGAIRLEIYSHINLSAEQNLTLLCDIARQILGFYR